MNKLIALPITNEGTVISGNSSGAGCLLDTYTSHHVDSNFDMSTGIFSLSNLGLTILHRAAHSQKPDIADMLLAHPAFLDLSQTQKENFILLSSSSRRTSLEIASLNGDIHLLTSLLAVVLQEKSCDQKLKILAPFLHHPLDLTTLIPELSSQEVINLNNYPIRPNGLIKLMQMATRCVQWNLSGIDLSGLTVAQVQSLNPDRLSVESIDLAKTQIQFNVRIALLYKLKCETLDLRHLDLDGLTMEKVRDLETYGLSVNSINLDKTRIKPYVRIALLAKLKCESWDLREVYLRGLTIEKVKDLETYGLSVNSIDLNETQIEPDVRIALLAKLKCKTWDLSGVNLSNFTVEQVQSLIPDGLSVKSLVLSRTHIKPDVLIALLAKLKCETWDLLDVGLRDLTVDQVQRLNPEGGSVKKINLYFTWIKPDVQIGLLAKLKCEIWELRYVDLSGLTVEKVQSLIPDGLSVKYIDLTETQIKPDVRIALLAKLNL